MKTLTLDLSAARAELSSEEISSAEARLRKIDIPDFAVWEPDFAAMDELAARFSRKKHFIIEGNGGSISTIRGLLTCFDVPGRNVYLLDTDDPDYVRSLRERCPIEDTLLIITSKSGESIDAIAAMLALQDYEIVFITGPSGALREVSRTRSIPCIDHPDLSGRFSGLTECALFPALVLGMDARGVLAGAREAYEKCAPQKPYRDNPALQLALGLDKLEKGGYTEIFLSVYSIALCGFFELITQLIHESVCKDGKGQTIYGGEAPENQHHTLQRFNSGRQNSVGVFITVHRDGKQEPLEAPEDIRSIRCRNLTLGQFEKFSLAECLKTEFEGTWQDSVEKGLPAAHIELDGITPRSVGTFIAFWQYVTLYSALLRDVDPFNQPGVERSKEYIFRLVGEK